MHLNSVFLIAISVATGQLPLEYMRDSNDMKAADLLPMISYVLGRAGAGKQELGWGVKLVPDISEFFWQNNFENSNFSEIDLSAFAVNKFSAKNSQV